MVKEQVFINNGDIYKENKVFEGAVSNNYITDLEADPIWTFYQNTVNGQKHYRSSAEFRKWLLDYDTGSTLVGYDKCPDVTLWCGEAFFPNGYGETELYFRIDDNTMLHSVAEYYDLPYPIDSEVESKLESPEVISSYTGLDMKPLVLGSIKFMDSSPVLLKFYAMYKYSGKWNLFNKWNPWSNVFNKRKLY